MRRIGPIIVLSLLVFAAPAAAKEVAKASICGPSGCAEVKEERLLIALADAGNPSDPPSQGAPWYRAEITMRAGDASDRFSLVIVPSARKLRSEDGTWMATLPKHVSRYEEMTRAVDPFPGSKLTGLDAPQAAQAPLAEPITPQDLVVADENGGFAWEWVGGGAAAALLAAGGILMFRRRRSGPSASTAAEPTA